MQHRLGGAFGAAADRFASDKEELAADGDLDGELFITRYGSIMLTTV